MEHQDFRVITIGSKEKKKANLSREIVKKNISNSNNIYRVNATKLENSDEIQIKYVDRDVVKKIIQARTLQKISQQDLANKLNVRKSVITELESGKMLKNNQFVSKVKKVLRI